MMENYNDKFDEWKSNGEIEQVSRDIFGFKEASNEYKNEPDKPEKKISFADLRQRRKIPRLKKTMVLSIMVVGVFAFLLIVNLFLQRKEKQRRYFDEQKNSIAVGNDFSLGDLERRGRYAEYDDARVMEGDDYYFMTPPSYTPVTTNAAAPAISGGVVYSAPRPPVNYYSDSDLLAMKAKIGKDDGYGLAARSVNYASIDPMGPKAISQEEYTRQRIDEIAKLTQMTSGSSNTINNTDSNTRYSDAGKYNPDNPPQGMDMTLLNEACLFPGTIIHAILVSRIDTDYPGPIHARVTENVYDSMSGKNLLIPQGTILQGNYSSSSIGVAKVQIAWESMVVNYQGSAYQVSLGGMAGVDKRGRAGIAGTLDDHYFEWLKAAGIISLFTLLNSEIAYQTRGQTNQQVRELMDVNQGIINQLGNKLIDRALNIQPTVRVANGTAVSVSVNTIVNLRPFPAIQAEERWIRKY